ncbi:hypothetical protein [Actinoplanes sp. NBRC 103695]|uniref:hypothetical protein n=1 Tax=Actinoplanes sp. NBRC 103695 TaxID=3032202 RepID=UPI0025539E17|nr:hypothetical protein [Actinoplanes sp. NBRC 103695]
MVSTIAEADAAAKRSGDPGSASEQAAPGHGGTVRRYVFDALSPDQVTGLRDIGRQISDQVERDRTGTSSAG